ncbi:MAG: hypothetical protein MJ099_02000 [Clostridia bacterium]|nr:hypothetical protein [Clostridia bacterium]
MEDSRFERFVNLTAMATKRIQRLKVDRMRKYGLSGAHTHCVLCLNRAGMTGLTQTELVAAEQMDASQISRVLRELIKKNYVTIEETGARYRRHYILTESGFAIAKEITDEVEFINQFVSGSIPQDEIEAFYNTFELICAGLEKAEQELIKCR